jgi:arsenate reductase (thioredoxin)
MDKPRILFLCSENAARSQMAEALLRSYAGDKYEAYSAGISPKDIHPLTKKVMEEIGINIDKQYAKALKDYMGKLHFSYLITVCAEADKRCPTTFPGMGQRLHWDIEDPAKFVGTTEEKLTKFRDIRDQIKQRIENWVDAQT